MYLLMHVIISILKMSRNAFFQSINGSVVMYLQFKQTTNELAVGAGHKLEESDWRVVGKCCCYSLATVARALLNFNIKLALVYLIFTGLCNR